MDWSSLEYRPEEPGILMPGLVLSGVRVEFPPIEPQTDRWLRINGVSVGAPSSSEQMEAYYLKVYQALVAGQSVRWERRVDAWGGVRAYIGDVYRFFITNQTSEPIGLPVCWDNAGYADNQVTWATWVELGRFVWQGEECTRETVIQFKPPDPNTFSRTGLLYIPPGEWDLNFMMGCLTIWQSYYVRIGMSHVQLSIPTWPPQDILARLAKRRQAAAWMTMERRRIG